jgi:hypothetical protein
MDRDANPEPPDRDERYEREDSPPRLSRPRRTTRPPNNYAREQEIRRPDDLQRKELRNVGKEFQKVKENLVPPSQNST